MIIYNGKNLEDFAVEAIGRGRYGSPARDIEQVHVPGLNGDLLFDSGGFLNANIEYPDCCIDHDFPTNFAALRTFLLADPGYHRLEDSYASDEFRMAEFRGPLTPDVHTGRGNRSGTFTLTFNATPQRYLKEGGEALVGIPLDIASDESVRAAAAAFPFPRLDLLINNAGILGNMEDGPEDELDFDLMLKVLNVNALGTLRVTAAFLPLLMKGAEKTVVNISSEAGSITDCRRTGWFGYCMSKAANNMQGALIHNTLRKAGGRVIQFLPLTFV